MFLTMISFTFKIKIFEKIGDLYLYFQNKPKKEIEDYLRGLLIAILDEFLKKYRFEWEKELNEIKHRVKRIVENESAKLLTTNEAFKKLKSREEKFFLLIKRKYDEKYIKFHEMENLEIRRSSLLRRRRS